MKAKFLLPLFTTAALASACAYMLMEDGGIKSDYGMRQSASLSPEASGMAEIMRLLKANVETGVIDPSDRYKMLKAIEKYSGKKSSSVGWIQMGPNNQGGRTRAILPLTDNHVFVGAVSGGLWESFDGANTWQQVTSFPSMMVSCITRTGDGTLYVGTGCTFEGAGGEGGSGFVGEGLFMSSDLGATWTIVPGTASQFSSSGYGYINELAADPNNPSRVWIASSGGLSSFNKSTGTLSNVPISTAGSGHDIKISADGSLMIFSSAGRGWRSLDGGNSWEAMSGSGATQLPSSNTSRAEFAISPQDPNYAYALITANNSRLRGGYVTTNKGATWSSIWPGGVDNIDLFNTFNNPQGFYDNCIIVDYNNKDRAIAGGVTLWDCGTNVEPNMIAFSFAFPGFPLYVHPDIHSFAYSPGGNVLYIGTDGGVFKSMDSGQTFLEANRGYITTQYYNMSHDPYQGIMGGTQDNGTIYVPNNGMMTDDLEGIQITGGDGFACEISQVTHGMNWAGFSTSQYGAIYRLDQQGNSGALNTDDIGQFYTKIRLYENTNDPLSQQKVLLVNPFDQTVTDSTFTLFTQNLNLPFDYTLPPGVELVYFETLVRPEIYSPVLITEDPNYPWLEPQVLTQTIIDCVTTEFPIDTVQVISGFVFEPDTFISTTTGNIIIIEVIVDTLYTDQIIYGSTTECDTTYYYASDVLTDVRGQIEVIDPYTTILAWGLQGGSGLRITRQGLNFGTTPEWWQLLPQIPNGDTVRDIEFSADGATMYYSTWGGRLWRIDNLHLIWKAADVNQAVATQLYSSGGPAVTGISVNPNNPNHVVISIGGYGGSNKVMQSMNAANAMSQAGANWQNIWSPGQGLNGMPCYDVLIDMYDSQRIMVGTEFGVWVTNNGGSAWNEANNGDMDRVPVFELRQQTWGPRQFSWPGNTGIIYAGTHGRGFFRTGDWVNVDEIADDSFSKKSDFLLVYPNPATDMVNMELSLNGGENVMMDIYNLQGKLVGSFNHMNVASGLQRFTVPVSELSNGTYLMLVRIGTVTKSAKFAVMR
jgi:hypothetical protein